MKILAGMFSTERHTYDRFLNVFRADFLIVSNLEASDTIEKNKVATIVDVINAIHATPVNTRCTFNVHVMSRSCRACSASRTRIDPCIENARLGSNGGSVLNYFDRVSRANALLPLCVKPKRSETD